MKIFALFAFLCFKAMDLYSQAANTLQIKPKIISLAGPTKSTANQLFTVVDARPNQKSFGLCKLLPYRYFSIETKDHPEEEIARALENICLEQRRDFAESNKFTVVLKKLWLTEDLLEDGKVPNARTAEKRAAGVIIDIAFYLNTENGCRPLYSFDTTYAGMKDMRYDAAEFINSALRLSAKKLMLADPESMTTAGLISSEELRKRHKNRYEIPILMTETYKRGVYKTFEEFKMNNPSIANFSLRSDKLSKTIFIGSEPDEYASRDVWGYCDGEKLFIKSGDNYFELIRWENTFLTNAARSLTKRSMIKPEAVLLEHFAPTASPGVKNRVGFTQELSLYQLDLEDGELY